MGLLDKGSESARPCGITDGPRQDYVPPRIARRGDNPPTKASVREKILGVLRREPVEWVHLRGMIPGRKGDGFHDVLTQLIEERIVRINHHGKFVYVEVRDRVKSAPKIAGVPEKKPDAVSALGDKDLHAMLVLMAQRTLDAEEHFQKALDSLLVEIESERAMRKTLQDAFFERVGKAV